MDYQVGEISVEITVQDGLSGRGNSWRKYLHNMGYQVGEITEKVLYKMGYQVGEIAEESTVQDGLSGRGNN